MNVGLIIKCFSIIMQDKRKLCEHHTRFFLFLYPVVVALYCCNKCYSLVFSVVTNSRALLYFLKTRDTIAMGDPLPACLKLLKTGSAWGKKKKKKERKKEKSLMCNFFFNFSSAIIPFIFQFLSV